MAAKKKKPSGVLEGLPGTSVIPPEQVPTVPNWSQPQETPPPLPDRNPIRQAWQEYWLEAQRQAAWLQYFRSRGWTQPMYPEGSAPGSHPKET